MDYTIIDAHAHLWLRQDTEVNGQRIQTLDNGKSLFMGEIRQMLPRLSPTDETRPKSFCRIWIMRRCRQR